MKLRKISIAFMSFILGLASCVKEDVAGIDKESENNFEGSSFASLVINLGSDTRATPGEDGDGFENGEVYEQNISELCIVSFRDAPGNDTLLLVKNFGKVDVLNQIAETGKFAIPVGKQNIYVIANPSLSIKYLLNSGNASTNKLTKEDFEKTVFTEVNTSDGKFMMTSCDGPKAFTAEKNATEPISVNITRVLAKVTYEKCNNENIYDLSNAEIKLTDIKLINKHKNSYLLRRVGSGVETDPVIIGGKETANLTGGTNYVIDPDFFIKIADFKTSKIAKDGKSGYYESETYKPLTDKPSSIIGYCHENTMLATSQLNYYTTGLVLKAKCTIKSFNNATVEGSEYQSDGTFYTTFDGKIYPSLASILNDFEISYNPGDDLKQILNDNSIEFVTYEKGICYYPVWLRHADNKDSAVMGIMEFGMVRNNVYKLKVSKINSIGLPTDDKIEDSGDPDEDYKVYLDAKITIMPWVVRYNDVEL